MDGWVEKDRKVWRARWREGGGRTSSKSGFRLKREAEEYLTTISAARLDGTYVDPKLGKVLYRTWAEEWFIGAVDLRPSTRARTRASLNTHVLPRWGDVPLNRITNVAVRRWVAELSDHLAPSTVAKEYLTFSKILRAAVDADILARVPLAGVKLPKIEPAEMRFLTPEQIHLLAETIDPRYRALVYLACYAGLRIGELAGLRWDRVLWDEHRVKINEIAVEVNGAMTFGPPKTRAGRRLVPLPEHVLTALEEHQVFWGRGDTDFVFPGERGGPLRVNNWRSREWKQAITRAEVAPLRPHDMRHTAVSLWIARGADVKQVAQWAGHASVVVVLDRYGHIFPHRDNDLVERLNETFEATRPTYI